MLMKSPMLRSNMQSALQQVKAKAHEEEKLTLVTDEFALSLMALWWGGGGVSQSRIATRSRVPTVMAPSQDKLQSFLKYFRAKRQ